jgi:hypothetical protein
MGDSIAEICWISSSTILVFGCSGEDGLSQMASCFLAIFRISILVSGDFTAAGVEVSGWLAF